MTPRRWSELAWPDVPGSFAELPVGLVPVGATEQHGPHLPTGTDTIIATALCEAASERTGAVVLPAVPVTASYGHGTELPGTLSLTPELLAAVVRQYAEWTATSGLRRLVFVNAHAGNGAALGMATDHLRLFRPDLRVAHVDWWRLDPVLLQEMTADGDDVHANRGETALMLAIAPDLVRTERVRDGAADDADRTGGLVFRYTAPALSTNGVTGRPSEATPALGAALLERAVSALAALVSRAAIEEPPLGEAPPARVAAPESFRTSP
jgi:creatinine amidohydrolase